MQVNISVPSLLIASACVVAMTTLCPAQGIGQEISVPRHLADGEEFQIKLQDLLEHGERLFNAQWTLQEGGGRPLTKGSGAPIADPSQPLVFPRAFNRISALDANSCAGCHNAPFGVSGGGGDYTAGVFVLAQRFDFSTFDHADPVRTKGALQEDGQPVTQQSIGNFRASLGMFGSGYIELLAREMTADLQAIRNATQPGQSKALLTKGVSFGNIARLADGSWVTSGVEGLPAPSLASSGPANPPNLIIRPFHQAGAVVSLRQFTNNAFNHHHGIQPTERFGSGSDPDGDGFTAEMTRADVTATSVFQAVMAVPGQVIPNNRDVERAIAKGGFIFGQIGCADCHRPLLPLISSVFVEPNPFNPAGNLRPGDAPNYSVDLNSDKLPQPRLAATGHGQFRRTWVPAFTDLKLHNICDGPNDPNGEKLDMQEPAGSTGFFAGNQKFLTRKLWGTANEPPYFHHGQFTTLRQAVLAHAGEARTSRVSFELLSPHDRDCVIEFLKSLQVLKPGTRHLVVDENGHRKGSGHGQDRG